MTTHNAPPVVYPLGRSRFQAVVLAGLWSAGLLSILFWLNASHSIGWRALLAAASLVFAGFSAIRGWKNSPIGQLVWDGQLWRWESQSYQAGVANQALFVIADLQSLLLIRLENQAHASLWLWVEQKACPERWLDLRRAVYSPHRAVDASRSSGFKYAQTSDVGQTQR
ncbi:MAG: hypothetical protein H7228_15535 [Polaromonas sp.]|nr:hypothetical protein [Polaromonas sp.]